MPQTTTLMFTQRKKMANNKTTGSAGQGAEKESVQMFPIGRERYVTVGEWRQQKRISVRQYLRYYGGDPKTNAPLYPTKKGMSLTVDSWVDLMFEKDRITEALKRVTEDEGDVCHRSHIGKNIFVTVDSGRPYVNIRQWFLPQGAEQVVPTKKGICLNGEEWQKVLEASKEVEKLVPEVKDAIPCGYRDDHSNQEGLLSCSHCSPDTFLDWQSILK
jgi:hypothetical protein